jgi:hypothetical protein
MFLRINGRTTPIDFPAGGSLLSELQEKGHANKGETGSKEVLRKTGIG